MKSGTGTCGAGKGNVGVSRLTEGERESSVRGMGWGLSETGMRISAGVEVAGLQLRRLLRARYPGFKSLALSLDGPELYDRVQFFDQRRPHGLGHGGHSQTELAQRDDH